MNDALASMIPYDSIGLYEQPKPRFFFKMPRVVPEQKSKFESDELFRRLSRECEVRMHFKCPKCNNFSVWRTKSVRLNFHKFGKLSNRKHTLTLIQKKKVHLISNHHRYFLQDGDSCRLTEERSKANNDMRQACVLIKVNINKCCCCDYNVDISHTHFFLPFAFLFHILLENIKTCVVFPMIFNTLTHNSEIKERRRKKEAK